MARGSIIKRPKYGPDAWQIMISMGKDVSGKRLRLIKTIHGTRKDAEKALALLTIEAARGVPTSNTTLEEWIAYFLDVRARELSPRTLEVYASMARNRIIPSLGHKRLKDITPQHIREFYGKVRSMGRKDGRPGPVGAATYGKYHRFLHVLFAEALRAGHVTSNLLDAVEPPGKEKTHARYFNDGELTAVMEKLALQPLTTRLPFTLLLTTGMRRGELLALRWQDIDLETGVIRIDKAVGRIKGGQEVKATKTAGSVRTVYALPEVIELLKSWQQEAGAHPEGYVFTWPDGGWWHIDYPSKAWIQFCRDNGLPEINLHGLRHTAASIMLAGGLPVTEASKALGHASPATTGRIYSHAMHDAAKRAAEVISRTMAARLAAPAAKTGENKKED